MADRLLEIILGVERRRMGRELQSAKRDVHAFARDTKNRISSAFRDSFGAVAGLGTVGGIAAIGRDVLQVDKKLTRLGIQAERSQASMHAFGDSLHDISDKTGQGANQLTDAAGVFVGLTGDIDSATAGMDVFARTATASGASVADVAKAGASLRNNLGLKTAAEFEKAFSVLLTQGKQGAVELRELAGLLPSLAPSFAQFEGGGGVRGLAELGANLQLVRQGFGTGAEAATGLNQLMVSISKNSKRFKGVKIFEKGENGEKRLRVFSAIIQDIGNSKLAKDPKKLQDAFGSDVAYRAFLQLKGQEEAIHDLFNAGLRSTAVQDDFVRYSESSAGRIERAWQKVQNTIARKLTPERIEALASALEQVAAIVGFVVDNFSSLVKIFALLKIAQWTMKLNSLSQAMGSVGSNTAKATGAAKELGSSGARAVGKFAKALGAVDAASLGYELGKVLDNALGISDALAGVEDTSVKKTEDDPTGRIAGLRLVKKQVEEFGAEQHSSDIIDPILGKDLLAKKGDAESRRSRADARVQAAQLEKRIKAAQAAHQLLAEGKVASAADLQEDRDRAAQTEGQRAGEALRRGDFGEAKTAFIAGLSPQRDRYRAAQTEGKRAGEALRRGDFSEAKAAFIAGLSARSERAEAERKQVAMAAKEAGLGGDASLIVEELRLLRQAQERAQREERERERKRGFSATFNFDRGG